MPDSSPDVPAPRDATAEPFRISVAATPDNVGRLRRRARTWLRAVLDDPDAVDDLTLALSEALENAADHAYADRPEPGSVELCALWSSSTVTLTVRDEGLWRARSSAPTTRGRGLDLIEQLVPHATVDTSAPGTLVTLRYPLG